MRIYLSLLVLGIAEVSSAADLGSPVPTLGSGKLGMGYENNHATPHDQIPSAKIGGNSLPTANHQIPTTDFTLICPCGDNCECQPGRCPACPALAAPQPVTVSYRQAWMRGLGWVWIAEQPASTSGGCSGGTCNVPRWSRR
jgi:hypothetical protein